MTPEQQQTSIELVVLAIAWGIALTVLRPKTRLDSFRQDLYRIRDHLFLQVMESGFDFADPAYVRTRQVLNGWIRVASRVSGISIFAFFLAAKFIRIPIEERVPAEDPALESLLLSTERAMHRRVFIQAITSLPGVLLIGGPFLFLWLRAVVSGGLSSFLDSLRKRPFVKKVDASAAHVGGLSSELNEYFCVS